MSRAATIRAAVARHRATGAPVSLVLREPAAVAAWARLRSLAGSTGVPLVTLAGRALAAGVAALFGPESPAAAP